MDVKHHVYFVCVQPKIYNLGTGNGISVLEIVAAFEKYTGKKVCLYLVNRESG